MRLTGTIEKIQKDKDHKDSIFGGVLSLATNSNAITLNIKHGNYEASVPGPGLIIPIDRLIAEDILYFRKSACENSNESEFKITARYFSSYVFFSVNMIEHFMYRNLWSASLNPLLRNSAEAVLNHRGRFEDRMNLWLQLFTGKNLSYISARAEWSQFIRLKDLRNELIHGTKPYFAFSVKDMAKYMNYIQIGVGELMKLIRDLQKLPSLMFIERLRTAPKVLYTKK